MVVFVLSFFRGRGVLAMIVSGLLDFEIVYIANELVQQKTKCCLVGSCS